jgi:protease IV
MAEPILPSDLLRNSSRALSNRLRLLNRRGLDYVLLRVTGNYPERRRERPRRFPLSLLPWPPPPPTVGGLTQQLERIAADPRVCGVVLLVCNLSAELATLTSLRQAIARFRETGKRAVAYLQDLSLGSYYLASACDEIIAPEAAEFLVTGLRTEVHFLKDTLALVGIEADLEAIAEYKTAPDTFRRSDMTAPHREMLEALLESLYGHLLAAIAAGRNLAPARLQELLDSVPLSAEAAREAGLLDAVCYEDQLPAHLAGNQAPAAILPWDRARRRLVHPLRWHSRRAIGVISLEGTIVPGTSRRPPLPIPLPLPFPAVQAGCDTLVHQLRAAARNKRLAAVVLHVDSPGGSALASDLIGREVARLRQVKPVVVSMGNRAASGGYYVSAPASAVFAQPTTLTGSIGIWGGKFVTRGLYARLRAGREVVSRGRAAGLYADTAPFDDEERDRIRRQLGEGYARFKTRVAEGRGKSEDEVEAVARGRVWSGEQALEQGLVDELGDLQAAAARARELAGISPKRQAPLVDVPVPDRYQVPLPEGAAFATWLEGLARLAQERILAMAPWTVAIKGL